MMGCELGVGELQTRGLRNFSKGSANGSDEGPSLGEERETTEPKAVRHFHRSCQRVG